MTLFLTYPGLLLRQNKRNHCCLMKGFFTFVILQKGNP